MSEEINGTRRGLIVFSISVAIGLAFSWVAGGNGVTYGPITVFMLCTVIAFAVNWIAFVPAAILQTEKFYDLVGAITYISVIFAAVNLSTELDLRATLAAAMVIVWCTRLGLFLFLRIHKAGEDRRFRDIKTNPVRFFGAWTIQGLWVILTASCALAIITSSERQSPDLFLYAGAVIWLVGFLVEVVADVQKFAFRGNEKNKGKFIQSGLWAWSQHPNYFGEITLWFGMMIMAIPVLQGGSWICVVSPVFVYLLLSKVSGIPLLDQYAERVWGDDPDYKAYTNRTSKLVPLPPRA